MEDGINDIDNINGSVDIVLVTVVVVVVVVVVTVSNDSSLGFRLGYLTPVAVTATLFLLMG